MSDKATCVLVFPSGLKPTTVVDIIRQSTEAMDSNASMWIWVRGQYEGGSLSWDHWKIASFLIHDGWQVRNEVAWSCKAADPAPENRLKRGYEKLLFLVRRKDYYFDRTMGTGNRDKPSRNKRGVLVTKSGVVGAKYMAQIAASPFMTDSEKVSAMDALNNASSKMEAGEISDFRLVLRGCQKATKSVAEKVDRDGFYMRMTTSRSSSMSDFWTDCSSDTNSSIPEGILLSALRLSCPIGGVVLDLFPSQINAETVVGAGRVYVSRTADGVGYADPVRETGLFEIEDRTYDQVQLEQNNEVCCVQ